jgi:sugar/nucleoside kinase (ribokinase family)
MDKESHNFKGGDTIIRWKDKKIGTVRIDGSSILIMEENWRCREIVRPNWSEWSLYVNLHDYKENKERYMNRLSKAGQLVVGTPGEAGSFVITFPTKTFAEKVVDEQGKCPYISFDQGMDS